MYVKDTNPPTRGLRVPGMSDKYREDGLNSESGILQVDEQTGEALLEHCPAIIEHTPGDDGAGS